MDQLPLALVVVVGPLAEPLPGINFGSHTVLVSISSWPVSGDKPSGKIHIIDNMANEEIVDPSSPSNSEVLNKYQSAADIANRSLTFALGLLEDGANIFGICTKVDAFILEQCSKVYNKGDTTKGIAFPCCISPNTTLAYYSPLGAEGALVLRRGDLVKVELGAHIDGFPAILATSVIVGATKEQPASGPAADLIQATNLTSEVALRAIRGGKSSQEIITLLQAAVSDLGVKYIEGIVSHSVSRDRLADEKIICVNPASHQQRLIEDCMASNYDVFVVDICLSAGAGQVKLSDKHRTTIFKRSEDNHGLRLKTSRAVLAEIQEKFGQMAFNIRSLENFTRAKMALNECTQHGVVNPYDVLEEGQEGTLTARIQFTTILMPAGPLKITDCQVPLEAITSSVEFKDVKLKELLATPVRITKKDKKANA